MFIAAVELSGRISRRTVREYSPILEYVKNKRKVAGLILIINSEGGDANSSEILYKKVQKIVEKKPVYSVIESIGASGAYWIASPSSRIYAMDTSLVGSIGVISMMPNVSGLLEKIGVVVEVNKIGEFKDMTSPFKETTPEGRERIMKIMQATFDKFRDEVKKNRKVPDEKDNDVFNGQVFSARDSKENGLVDMIGDASQAADDMSEALSIQRKVKTLSPRQGMISRFNPLASVMSYLSDLIRWD